MPTDTVLALPAPMQDDPADPYPEYSSRDEFERAQWFGDSARRPEPIFDKQLEDFYAINDDEIPF